MFQNNKTITLKLLTPDNKSAPHYVFKRADNWIKKNKPHTNKKIPYEVWLIIDSEENNNRPSKELKDIQTKCEKHKYNLAISNPAFEYWLLLHFEDGKGVTSLQSCCNKLAEHLPNHSENKPNLDIKELQSNNNIQKAISRAKDHIEQQPSTGVHLLIEELVKNPDIT